MTSGPSSEGASPSAPPARPRAPGLVSGGSVALMMVALAAVALTSRPDSPPSIAELAPQAVTQIDEAPADQGVTGSGRGPGSAATTTPPTATQATTSTTAAIEVPRVRRCIGDPARQTEDPQSPPCVPYFDGDNGGATAKGVTADEIRVAFPLQFFEDPQLAYDLARFFNSRYEFYGRKIRLVTTPSRGGPQPNPADMQADARDVATTYDAFASLGYPDRKGAEHHYYDKLAELGVMSATYRAQQLATEARFSRFAPYQWGWLPPTDQSMRLIGGFMCRTLAGRPPRFAGVPTSDAAQRKFGVLYQRTPDGSTPDLTELVAALKGCSGPPTMVEDQSAASNPTQVMLKLTEADVTSVLCICDVLSLRDSYMAAASRQGFFPEWIVSGVIDLDLDNSYHGAPPDQASRVMGVSFRNPVLPRQEMAWYWAVKEAAPTKDPTGGTTYSAMARYAQLSVLAAGIQMAGPRLTPASFQAGLFKARFPNPGAGGPPYFQARVGFPGGRHTMTDDATLFWYSPSEPGTVDPEFPGSVCYVNGGRRYTASTFPADDRDLFRAPCK